MPAKRASRSATRPAAVEPPPTATAQAAASPPTAAAESPDAYRRRPRQSRGQARVELLLDAAATVIAEQGLQAATAEAIALKAWLKLASEALLPVQSSPEAMRKTEQRAVVLQLERLMDYPMVRREVEAGKLTLHGWHYVIEDGEVHVFDVKQGDFVPASVASNSGTGPYQPYVEHDGQILAGE